MNMTSSTVISDPLQRTLADRLAAMIAWGLGAALFLTLGWAVMRPDDPLGTVSVLSQRGGLLMILQAGALAAVAAAVATAVAGRTMADIGTLTAALGLALVSLRGSTTAHLLIGGAADAVSFERGLALALARETVGWSFVVVAALAASTAVARWFFGLPKYGGRRQAGLSDLATSALAGYDVPRFSGRWFGVSSSEQTAPGDGLRHTALATIVGLAVMALLSASVSSRAIQHGQVCFGVAVAVAVGCYVAHRFVPVRSALWVILSVPLIAVAGYLWAAISPAPAWRPPGIPGSQFLRVLPVQFISVGTAAALFMFWSMFVPTAGSSAGRAPGRPAGTLRGTA